MPEVVLRRAIPADVAWLELWDTDADVIACCTDNPDATVAFEDADWGREIAAQDEHSQYFIAELDGRPIGAMQVCDPHLESSHYWGDIAPNLCASRSTAASPTRE
jgi:aminoglycoside 6'-N-acetyltransferase